MGPEVYNPESIKRLAALGVQECLAAFRDAYAGGVDNRTLESMIGEMNHYADTVIKPVRDAGV
jgi:hypothetical protein